MRNLVLVLVLVLGPLRAFAGVEDDLREGDKYFEQGDWKRAASEYDRAIAQAPGQVSAAAYGKRAAIFIIQNDFKGGLAFVERAKTRSAQLANAPELLEQEAVILWQTEKKDAAIAIADKVVIARPQAFTNQKLVGEFYAARDPVKTAAAFEQYLAYRPAELEAGDVLPRVRLGFAYLANGRTALGDGDDGKAQQLYQKAAEQFDLVQRKFGKKANAQVNADNGLCAAYAGLGRYDQAVTACERVVANPKHVDASGSVWFNLATAYLARKQTKKARNAANEFTRLRKTEARGFLLAGDTYYEDREFTQALDQYLRAEKLLKPAQKHEQVELSIRLGKTYRRLPTPNVSLALDKLAGAYDQNPGSLELAIELGTAYVEAKQDGKAATLTEHLLAGSTLGKAPQEQRAAVLVIAGKSLFNQRKLKDARARFEAAAQLKSQDVQIRRELVETINEQAFEAGKDTKSAQGLLEQALAIDQASPVTVTNLAILAIERGDCEAGGKLVARAATLRGNDTVVLARLRARSLACATPMTKAADTRAVLEAYSAAEAEAKKANAQLTLAEIETEMAPLVWDTDPAGAVEKLELAVQIAAQEPEIAPATKRNLALALYRRGWKSMRDGKPNEASADFERAGRDTSLLKGTEPVALEFSLALAQLDAGRTADAAKQFKALAARGNQSAYLKGAYAKVGAQFLAAYASYRGATGAQRQQACTDLAKLEGELGGRGKELGSACWESVAYDEWRSGAAGAASKALASADKNPSPEQKRRLAVDRATLALTKDKLGELEALGDRPPEALVDLGIVYDLLGKPKEAYEAWQRAKAKGVAARDLQKWIDAKRRIYGY